MRIPVLLIGVILSLSLAGCGGAGDAEQPAAQPPAAEAEPAAQAEPAKEPAGEDHKQMGPDQRPDREAEPLQFFYWRVDKMFTDFDANEDGKLEFEEFSGEKTNFDRIDRNADGFLTKQEVIDDGAQHVVEPGGVSEQ